MAKGTRVEPVRAKSVSASWLKNAMKGIGASTTSVIKQYAPNVSATLSAGKNSVQKAAESVKNRNTNKNILSENRYVQMANKAFRNALADIKAGNIAGNEDRAIDAINKSMGLDFDNVFDEVNNSGVSFGDEGNDVNINVVNTGVSDGMITLNDSVRRNTELTLKTNKAQMDAQIAVSSAMMQQSQAIGSQVIQHLAGIENNLAALVEYNNTNMNKFIEASLAFMERTGPAVEKNASYDDNKITSGKLFNSTGGIDVGVYKKYIKENLKKELNSSQFSMIAGMLSDDMLETLATNPLGSLSTMAIEYMVPKALTTTIQGIEQTFNVMVPNMLHKLYKWGEEQSNGLFNTMTTRLAKALGLSGERIDKIDRRDIKIERGAIPFDGETKNAIMNVIPKQLRDQTAYLKYIAEHFGLKGKKATEAIQNQSYFYDYEKNKMVSEKEVGDTILKGLQKAIEAGFNGTQFDRKIRKEIENASGGDDDAKKALNRVLQQFYNYMESTQKTYDYSNGLPKELKDVIGSFSGNKNSIKAFSNILEQISRQNSLYMANLTMGQQKAIQSRNKYIQEIQANPVSSGILETGIFDRKVLNSEGKLERIDVDTLLNEYAKRRADELKKGKYKYSVNIEDQPDTLYNGLQQGGELLKKLRASGNKAVSGIGSAILTGDADRMYASLGEAGKMIGESVAESIATPIKESVLGTKDQNGYRQGGIISPAINTLRDSLNEVSQRFTGKAYVDSNGKVHEAKEKSIISTITESVKTKFFGEKEEKDPDKKGILTTLTDGFKQSLVNWHDAIFGTSDDPEKEINKDNVLKEINKKVKEKLPDAIVGAIGGVGLSFASGGLLGAIVGGPLSGALIGSTIGIISKSEGFKKFLFGEEDMDNGLITKKTQEFFKKNKNLMIGSAVVGGVKGAVTGGGLLGGLVGGPIAGALMGMATTTVLKSKTFHDFLFGDEENGRKGVINSFKEAAGKFIKRDKDSEYLRGKGEALGMGIMAVGAGATIGRLISKMGLMNYVASPVGPIGGAAIGLALTIRSQGDNFREFLFGNKKTKTKKDKEYSEGLLGQIRNSLMANLVNPIKYTVMDIAKDASFTLKHEVLAPIEFAMEPLVSGIGSIIHGINTKAADVLNSVADVTKEKIISPLASFADTVIIKPAAKAAKFLTKSIYYFGKKMITTPVKIVTGAINFLTSPFRQALKKINPVRWIGKLFKITGSAIKSAIHGVFNSLPVKAVAGVAKIGARTVSGAMDIVSGYMDYKNRANRDKLRGENYDSYLMKRYEKEVEKGKVALDADGNPISFESWKSGIDDYSARKKYWKKNQREADLLDLKVSKEENKRRSKDEKTIYKLTGGAAYENTEENRRLAELKSGKKVNWRSKANDADKIKTTENLTDADLVKKDPTKMTPEVRQVSLLQKIYDWLRKRDENGNPLGKGLSREEKKAAKQAEREAEEAREDERVAAQFDEEMANGDASSFTWMKDILKEMGMNEEEYAKLNNSELAGYFFGAGGSFKDILSYGKEHAKESKYYNKFKDFLDGFTGEGYAEGSDNTEAGYSVVGEAGRPEIVMTEKGGKVLSDKDKSIKVSLQNINRGLFDEMTNAFSKPTLTPEQIRQIQEDRYVSEEDRETLVSLEEARKSSQESIAAQKKSAKDAALDKAVTAKEQDQAKKEKEKEDREKSMAASMRSISGDPKDGNRTKKGNSFFDFVKGVFSKKGLIGGLSLLLMAKFPQIISLAAKGIGWLLGEGAELIGNIANGIASIVSIVGEKIGKDAKWHNENGATTNGKGSAEELNEGLTDIKELAQGKIGKYLTNDEGNLDSRSASKANALYTLTLGTKKGRKITGAIDDVFGVQIDPVRKLENAAEEVKLSQIEKIKDNLDTLTPESVKKFKEARAAKKAQREAEREAKKAAKKGGKKVVEKATDATIDTATKKAASEGVEEVTETAGKKLVNEGAEEVVETVGKNVADATFDNGVKKAGQEVVEDIAQSAVDDVGDFILKNGDNVVDASASKTFKDKIISLIKTFIDGIKTKVVDKFGDKIKGKLRDSIFKKAIDMVKKTLEKHTYLNIAIAKISAILGISVGTAAAGLAGFIAKYGYISLSALNGLTGAGKLFQVSPDDVDWIMRGISAVFYGFSATTIGSIVDVIVSLVAAAFGIDIYNIIATAIYSVLSIVLNGKTKEELTAAQDSWKEEYVKYQDSRLKDQYNSLKKSGLLPQVTDENGVSRIATLDEYRENVRAGTNGFYGNYDSFEDWNSKENADVASGAMYAAGDGIGTAYRAGKDFFAGKEYYIDKSENRYYENADGTYTQVDKDGNMVSTAIPNKEYFLANTDGAKHADKGVADYVHDVLFTNPVTKEKKNTTSASTESGTLYGDLLNTQSQVFGETLTSTTETDIELTKSYAENVGDVTLQPMTKRKTYVDSSGNYYLRSGSKFTKYSMNGTVIKKNISEDDFKYMVSHGVVSYQEINPIDAKKYLKSVQSNVTSYWNTGNASTIVASSANTGSDYSNIMNRVNIRNNSLRGGSGVGRRGGRGMDTMNGYPYVAQTDPRWSSDSYDYLGDRATLGDTGCGPAAMSMAISGATGREVDLHTLANYAKITGTRDDTGTNWNFISSSANQFGLQTAQTLNPSADSISRAVDDGNPVVLSGVSSGSNTPYTEAGHYVVAVGKDANGNILINDPRGKGFSRAYSPQELSKYTGSSWEIGKGGRGWIRRRGGYGPTDGADMLNGFPYLKQNDSRWGSKMFSSHNDASQTIGTSACGPTSMAMILRSYGANVTPVDTCQYALDNGFRTYDSGTDMAFFPSIAQKYGLTMKSFEPGDGTGVVTSLQNKIPLIASMGPGTFTSYGHYIVLSGMQDRDHIMVNDPANEDRSKKTYPITTFTRESNNGFMAFSKNGVGSINNLSNVGAISGTDANAGVTAQTGTESGTAATTLDKLGNFFTNLGNAVIDSLFTGKFDTTFEQIWNNSGTPVSAATLSDNSSINTNLSGSGNEEKIYNFLVSNGLTPEGAAGLMGNLESESGMDPRNLENQAESKIGYTDANYTEAIDSGKISRAEFLNPLPGKVYGYGLAQWTSTGRKAGLYDLAKSKNTSIGDLGTQLEWLMTELQSNYPGVLSVLKSTHDLTEASNAVLHKFEAPADQSATVEASRAANGQKWLNKFSGGSGWRNDLKIKSMLKKLGGRGLLRKLRLGGRGGTTAEAREAVIGWMLSIIGRNQYRLDGSRVRVMDGVDGHGFGDCSSTCWKVYERATGLQIGTYTGDMYNKGEMVLGVNTSTDTYPDESKMLPGDLIFFYGKEANPNDLENSIGHVEMYLGSGQVAGHGGGTGPKIQTLNGCINWRVQNGYGTWSNVQRYITDANAGSLTITPADPSKFKVANTFTDGNGVSKNGVNSNASTTGVTTITVTAESMNTLDRLGNFFTNLGNATMEGLFTGNWNTDFNTLWNAGVSSSNSTSGGTTNASLSTPGGSFPTYTDLTEDHKSTIARVITRETGGDDLKACYQEASQMANLNEVSKKQPATDAGLWSTLNSGWYASTSFSGDISDNARQAVEDVLVKGHRVLPRYVTEHDMFPRDAAISGHWGNGNSEDRSQYTRHQTTIVQNPSYFSPPASYKFYDFFGQNRDGDVSGYYPEDYEKYKNDTPWGGSGKGVSKESLEDKSTRVASILRRTGKTQGDPGAVRKARATVRNVNARKSGGYGSATNTQVITKTSTNAVGTTTGSNNYSNSRLMQILQGAEAAKSSGNTSELIGFVIEILAIIADNTGLSANSLERANALIANLKGGNTNIIATGNLGDSGTTSALAKESTKPSKNLILAQKIASGR